MSMRCRIFGHEPSPAPVWNAGRHFSACKRCGVDLVRGRGMVWHPVPPGMRIVWKTRDAQEDPAGPDAGAEKEVPASGTAPDDIGPQRLLLEFTGQETADRNADTRHPGDSLAERDPSAHERWY